MVEFPGMASLTFKLDLFIIRAIQASSMVFFSKNLTLFEKILTFQTPFIVSRVLILWLLMIKFAL